MSHRHGHARASEHGGRSGHDIGTAFRTSTALNLALVVIETIAGLSAHSVALLADAAHNFSDVLGLLLAWGAARLATRAGTNRRTYGLKRSTILAALTNAVLVVVAVGGVCWEAIGRLRAPPHVEGITVMSVAAIGVVVNACSAMLFVKRSQHDMNIRAALLHLAADAAVGVGVVVSGVILISTGWSWVDPVTSIVVSLTVLAATWQLLREALDLALDAVPRHVDIDGLRAHLEALQSVREVHDLHVWPMSTTEIALTAHIVMPWPRDPPAFLDGVRRELQDKFGIAHITIQLEPEGEECGAHPC